MNARPIRTGDIRSAGYEEGSNAPSLQGGALETSTMTETIAVWDVLKEFGFTPDLSNISDIAPRLFFDFGNFKLSAIACIGSHFYPVIIFSGVLATPRTTAEVWFELPQQIPSREHLAAFLVYNLDAYAVNRIFQPNRDVDWITMGRQHRHLLPWEVERKAYNARPHCSVQRDWLRLGLKSVAEIISKADDTANVEFWFDGSVLTIKCSEQVVPMAADGKAWVTKFVIPAGNLRNLPKRLTQDDVEISVHEGQLHIGRNCFNGVKEKP